MLRKLFYASAIAANLLPAANPAFANDGRRLFDAIVGGGIQMLGGDLRRDPSPGAGGQNRRQVQAAQQQSADDVKLDRREMAEVQSALVRMGFPLKVDGVAGTATGKAISQFLSDRGLDPYETSIHEARRLIVAEANRMGSTVQVATSEQNDASPAATAAMTEIGPASSTVESWKRLGATIAENRVLVRLYADDADKRAIAKPFDLLALAHIPPSRTSLQTAYYFTREYTDASQFRSLFPFGEDVKGQVQLNNDPFAKKAAVERFNAEYRKGLIAQKPILPMAIRLRWPMVLQQYDFTSQSFPAYHRAGAHSNAGRIEFSVFEGARTFSTDLTSLPEKLALDEAAARALSERTKAKATDRFGGITVYVAADFDITSMIAESTGEGIGDLSLHANMPGLKSTVFAAASRMAIYEDAELTRQIAELPIDAITIKPAAPVTKAAEPMPESLPLATDVDADDNAAPRSRFEVLGVRLGMPVAEAAALIADHVKSGPSSVLKPGPASIGSMTPCEDTLLRARQENLGKEELVRVLRSNDCAIPKTGPLEFAFGYDLKLSDKLTERIAVYRAGTELGDPVVTAVSRKFTASEVGSLLTDGLPKAYGDDFVVSKSGADDRIWPDRPSQAGRIAKNANGECVPFWNGDHGFPAGNIYQDCGAFIRADKFRMVLIDTGYAARVTREAAAEAEKAKTTPQIKF